MTFSLCHFRLAWSRWCWFLAETMFALLGIDPEIEVYDAANRPLAIAAKQPVTDVLA